MTDKPAERTANMVHYPGKDASDPNALDEYIDGMLDGTVSFSSLSATTVSATTVSASGTVSGATLTYNSTDVVRHSAEISSALTTEAYVDFTIPSWASEIDVMFTNVSMNGANNIYLQIGDSGGLETTGYDAIIDAGGGAYTANTTGVFLTTGSAATYVWYGMATLRNTYDGSSATWVFTGLLGNTTTTNRMHPSSGIKTLSGALTTLRVVAGANTFDSGYISVRCRS